MGTLISTLVIPALGCLYIPSVASVAECEASGGPGASAFPGSYQQAGLVILRPEGSVIWGGSWLAAGVQGFRVCVFGGPNWTEVEPSTATGNRGVRGFGPGLSIAAPATSARGRRAAWTASGFVPRRNGHQGPYGPDELDPPLPNSFTLGRTSAR